VDLDFEEVNPLLGAQLERLVLRTDALNEESDGFDSDDGSGNWMIGGEDDDDDGYDDSEPEVEYDSSYTTDEGGSGN